MSITTPASAIGSATSSRGQLRLLSALFFFSGLPALVYQLLWQRALFGIFGINIEAVTIVVAAFMLGLGLGSAIGGWLSRRSSVPLLLLLALIEAVTAVFGLLSLDLFDRVGLLLAGASLPTVAVATLGLVLVPTLLMGATLPLLVGHLTLRLRNVGQSVGVLYYANTLGAATACLLGAVLLFPYLGMRGSVIVAACINAGVAIAAVAFYWIDRRGQHQQTVPADLGARGALAPTMPFGWAVGVAAAVGYVSLSYEILLFRAMSFGSGGSASAFAVTLGAFLVGIASGSRRAAEVCAVPGSPDLGRRLIWAIVLAGIVGATLLPLVAHLNWMRVGVLAVLIVQTYLIARLWGFVLPAVVHVSVSPDEAAGQRTAWIYLANIAGSVCGTVVTGFVLMDLMGMVAINQLLVAAGLLVLVACWPLWRAFPVTDARPWRLGFGVAAVVGLSLWVPVGSSGLLESLMWKGQPQGDRPFSRAVENRSGIITVSDDGTIYGHGAYDGHFSVDLVNDVNGIVRPFALSLFHPAPRRVLLIGLSSGSWAQVIAHHPQVETVTAVEINPGYAGLIGERSEVASVLSNPKVRIVADDGRRWLRRHPEERFDVIVSNTSFHYRAHASNLLSTEFLQLARSHLRPGGVMYFNTTESARAQRTGCLAFAHGARFTNHMIVSDSPIDWNLARWKSVLAAYSIDGRAVLPASDPAAVRLLDQLAQGQTPSAAAGAAGAADALIETCPSVLKRTVGQVPITDDNMGHEWLRLWPMR